MNRVVSFCALLFISCLRCSEAEESSNVIPFQGQLADQNGQTLNPVSAVTLVFRLYQIPVGGVAIWEESQPNISVNTGRFSVLLGSRTLLPSYSYFNSTIYLGITVDDGNPATADVEMRPRQAIIPVISASYAKEASKLNGYDWSPLFGTNNPIDGKISGSKIADRSVSSAQLTPGIAVPVGGVIMWWGTVASIPENFELCDGSSPITPAAALTGLKPDLRDRFPKGALPDTTDDRSNSVTGGSHTIPERLTGETTLTISQIPSHTHGVNDPGHSHSVTAGTLSYKAGPGQQYIPNAGSRTSTETTGITIQSVGGGDAHNHTIPAHDNRPAFLEMFFIIRVK
jgi:microcystin-dependent protein